MSSKADKTMKKYIKTRDTLFPELKEEGAIWHSKTNDGWRNIPRGITYIMNIMDDLSTGSPPSKVYLALWLRSYESYFINDISLKALATETNHKGQRAETTLKRKLKALTDLGFIKEKNDYSMIAIPNPYLAVKKLNSEGKVSEEQWNSLVLRMNDIGENSF